jgi:hypothetical protein
MASHLQRILTHFQSSSRALSLTELARELDLETGTLQGMIDYWVRKGKLREVVAASSACNLCNTQNACPFVITLPRYYELAGESTAENDMTIPQCSCSH